MNIIRSSTKSQQQQRQQQKQTYSVSNASLQEHTTINARTNATSESPANGTSNKVDHDTEIFHYRKVTVDNNVRPMVTGLVVETFEVQGFVVGICGEFSQRHCIMHQRDRIVEVCRSPATLIKKVGQQQQRYLFWLQSRSTKNLSGRATARSSEYFQTVTVHGASKKKAWRLVGQIRFPNHHQKSFGMTVNRNSLTTLTRKWYPVQKVTRRIVQQRV